MKIEGKVPGKKIGVFWVEILKCKILLSSCSLVGLYVSLQVKVTEKFDENFQSIFRVGFEVKVFPLQLKNVGGRECPLSWASC